MGQRNDGPQDFPAFMVTARWSLCQSSCHSGDHQPGNEPPEFMDLYIGSERKNDFRTTGSGKPEFGFLTDDAVGLPSLADKQLVLDRAILAMPFGGDAESLRYHLTR